MHSTYAVLFCPIAAALMAIWLGACQTPESPTPNPERDRLCTLGHTYFRQARYRDALAAYQQAVALDSLSAEAHCHLATAYVKLGRRDSAETAYLAAIRLDSSLVLAYHNLAVASGSSSTTSRGAPATSCFPGSLWAIIFLAKTSQPSADSAVRPVLELGYPRSRRDTSGGRFLGAANRLSPLCRCGSAAGGDHSATHLDRQQANRRTQG